MCPSDLSGCLKRGITSSDTFRLALQLQQWKEGGREGGREGGKESQITNDPPMPVYRYNTEKKIV